MSKYAIDRVKKMMPYTANQNVYQAKLDANESAYPIGIEMKKKIAQAIMEDGLNRYPDPMASEVCKKYATLMNLKANTLVAGNGSDELLGVIEAAFLGDGDKLMCFSHDFSMYKFYGELMGNEVVEIEKKEDLILTAKDIIASYETHKPKVIMFSNPCNPTGIGMLRQDVIAVLKAVDGIVVVDEAYMEFWNQSVLDLVCEYDNLIVLKTCSKAFALAGIRLGFAVSNPEITQVLKKVKSPYNVNILTQIAASVAFDYGDYVQEEVKSLHKSRAYLYEKLKGIQTEGRHVFVVFPSCANFLFIKTDCAMKIDEALKKENMIIRNYNNGYIRISIGTQREMEQVYQVIEKILIR